MFDFTIFITEKAVNICFIGDERKYFAATFTSSWNHIISESFSHSTENFNESLTTSPKFTPCCILLILYSS